MVLDVIINNVSVSVPIDKPFQPDLDAIHSQIERFASSKGIDIADLDVKGLILKMIKGIVGCERGCPANAKDLESTGHKGFEGTIRRRRHTHSSYNDCRWRHLLSQDVSRFLKVFQVFEGTPMLPHSDCLISRNNLFVNFDTQFENDVAYKKNYLLHYERFNN